MIVTTENYQPTKIQFERARGMAAAYGHEWAMTGLPVEAWAWTRAEITRWVVAHRMEGELGGIEAPTIEQYGDDTFVIKHKTSTGRTFWRVFDDGAIEIGICRPDAIVLNTYVQDGEPVSPGHAASQAPFHERHVVALDTAIDAALKACGRFDDRAPITAWLSNEALIDPVGTLSASEQPSYWFGEAPTYPHVLVVPDMEQWAVMHEKKVMAYFESEAEAATYAMRVSWRMAQPAIAAMALFPPIL